MLLALLLACPEPKDDTAALDDTADMTDTDPPDLVSDCTTEACGGDPEGEWTVATTCWDETEQPLDSEDCPSGTVVITDLTITGSVSVTADARYETNFTSFSQSFVVHLPDDCTQGLACDDIQGLMEDSIPGVICIDGATEGCDCSATISSDGEVDVGAWAVAGNQITFTSDDGSDPETNDFCADHDELWVHFLGTDGTEFSMLLTK